MKYELSKPFYAQVEQVKIGQSYLFAIVSKDEQERKLRLEELEKALEKTDIQLEKIRLEVFDSKDIARAEEEILLRSFFEPGKLIIIKSSEKLMILASELLKNLPSHVVVVLLLDTLTDKFYQLIKSKVVALELKEEKPWLQKERLVSVIVDYFVEHNKKISKELSTEMVEMIGLDEGGLLRFSENLICYCLDKQVVSSDDLKACIKTRSKLGGWQLVENLLLGEKVNFDRMDESLDPLGVIAQLRYKLQQIQKWKGNLEEGYQSQKSKYLAIYNHVNHQFFLSLSQFLFDLEFSIKNGFNAGTFYLDLIQVKIESLRQSNYNMSKH